MSETALSRAIRDALDRLGVPNERVQCGMAHGLSGGMMQLASAGTPDIWTPYVWLETKVADGKLRPDQIIWHRRAKAHGVLVGVPRTEREALAMVLKARKAARV